MLELKPLVTIEEFEKYLEDIGKKDRTIKTYVEVLKAFERFLNERGKTLDNFTVIDAQIFAGNVSTSMANIFVPAIRKYAWLRVEKAKPLDKELFNEELYRYHSLRESLQYAEEIEEIEEMALEPDEVVELINKTAENPLLQAGIVVHAYFGFRPVEATGYQYIIRKKLVGIGLNYAKFNWDERHLRMFRAKVLSERFLVWDSAITPYLKTWIKHLKDLMQLKCPHEWLTKKLKNEKYQLDSKRITAMTFRKTFRTQMDLRGVEDRWIKYLMGHRVRIERKYQDMKELLPVLRDIMENPEKHYLLDVLGEIQ